MSEKVTIQDIIELLAEKHSMTKKDAEIFVKGMFELIEEALVTEKYVKVKGLGTFKLTEVESRESVNVNTGERIEIQGHTKISFTPDSSMKDLINKPFAHFETVILNENTKLEDTETEIEGEEEDTFDGNAPKPKQTIAAKEVEFIEAENTEDSPNENAIAAEDTTPVIEETIIEEPAPSVEITEEEIQIIEPEKESEDIVTEAEKDIVAETAVPQTVSPLAETIEGNEVTDKPQEEVMTIADAAILAARKACEEKTSLETIASEEATPSEKTVITPVTSDFEKEQKIEETTETQEISEEKKNRVSLGVILAIILIACIAGGIYWYLQSDKTSDLQSPATIKNTQEQLEEDIPAIPVNDSLMQGKDTANIWTNVAGKETISQSQQTVSPSTEKSSGVATTANVAKETLADTVDDEIQATLANGSIEIRNEKKPIPQVLNPGEQAVYNKITDNTKVSDINLYMVTSWKEGKMVFRRTEMAEIAQRLSRHFNVNIILQSKKIFNYKYSATFTTETFEEILQLLEKTAPIKCTMIEPKQASDYSYTRRTVIIEAR